MVWLCTMVHTSPHTRRLLRPPRAARQSPTAVAGGARAPVFSQVQLQMPAAMSSGAHGQAHDGQTSRGTARSARTARRSCNEQRRCYARAGRWARDTATGGAAAACRAAKQRCSVEADDADESRGACWARPPPHPPPMPRWRSPMPCPPPPPRPPPPPCPPPPPRPAPAPLPPPSSQPAPPLYPQPQTPPAAVVLSPHSLLPPPLPPPTPSLAARRASVCACGARLTIAPDCA